MEDQSNIKAHKEILSSDVNFRLEPKVLVPPEAEQKFNEWIEILVENKFEETEKLSLYQKLRAKILQYNISKKKRNSIAITTSGFLLLILFSIATSSFYYLIILIVCLLGYLKLMLETSKTQFEIEEIDHSMKIESYKFRIANNHAEKKVEKGQYQDAIDLYNRLISRNQNIWYLYSNKGFCEIKLNKLDLAIQTYTLFENRVLKLEEDTSKKDKYLAIIYNQLGSIYERKSGLEFAHYYFLKSIKYRETEYIIINLLSICIKLNKFEEAYTWFSKLKANRNYNETLSLIPQNTIIQLKRLSWIN